MLGEMGKMSLFCRIILNHTKVLKVFTYFISLFLAHLIAHPFHKYRCRRQHQQTNKKKMINIRVLCAVAVIAALGLTSMVYGGPARSLATVVAARPVKIPRSIRAPFRNDQIMTARGFGKRSQQLFKYRDGKLDESDLTQTL